MPFWGFNYIFVDQDAEQPKMCVNAVVIVSYYKRYNLLWCRNDIRDNGKPVTHLLLCTMNTCNQSLVIMYVIYDICFLWDDVNVTISLRDIHFYQIIINSSMSLFRQQYLITSVKLKIISLCNLDSRIWFHTYTMYTGWNVNVNITSIQHPLHLCVHNFERIVFCVCRIYKEKA